MDTYSATFQNSLPAIPESRTEEKTRGYHRNNKAYYAMPLRNNIVAEVTFGLYDIPDGGTSGEMTMRWHHIGHVIAPRLEAFDDSWEVLFSFPDLFSAMAAVDGQNITEEQFCAILNKCGFRDLTEYKNPNIPPSYELSSAPTLQFFINNCLKTPMAMEVVTIDQGEHLFKIAVFDENEQQARALASQLCSLLNQQS